MAGLLKSRTLTISISCDPKTVYGFVSNPENLPKWAKALCRSVKQSNGAWVIETPQGPVTIRFVSRNELGVLDHSVSPSPGVTIAVPMRVVPNASGSEVLLTLFQLPEMSAEQYAKDMEWVEQDLATLKQVLEGENRQ